MLNVGKTQESFLVDMIRNRFPESSLILSISSHFLLLNFNKSFQLIKQKIYFLSRKYLRCVTLGSRHRQNPFNSFLYQITILINIQFMIQQNIQKTDFNCQYLYPQLSPQARVLIVLDGTHAYAAKILKND